MNWSFWGCVICALMLVLSIELFSKRLLLLTWGTCEEI